MPHDLRVIIAARLFYQKALHRLTYELARKGIIYHVICTPYFADFADYNLEGSENIVLHMSGSYGRTLSSRPSFNFFAAKNICRLTKMKEADVIHAEGEGASSLLNAGAPTITSVNQALPSMKIWRNKGSGLSVFRSSAYSLFEVSQLFLSDLITYKDLVTDLICTKSYSLNAIFMWKRVSFSVSILFGVWVGYIYSRLSQENVASGSVQ